MAPNQNGDDFIGWKVFEKIGIGVVNSRAVFSMNLKREIILITIPLEINCSIRAIWTINDTRIEHVKEFPIDDIQYNKESISILGSVGDSGFIAPLVDPNLPSNALNLRPTGKLWDNFITEATRLHIATSVMES